MLHQLTVTEPHRFATVDSFRFWNSSEMVKVVSSLINYLKNLCNINWKGLFLKSTFIDYLGNSLQNLNFYCPKRFQQTCPLKEGTTLISDICTEFGYLWFFSFPCCKFLNGLKDGSIDFQSQQLLSKRCCIVDNGMI